MIGSMSLTTVTSGTNGTFRIHTESGSQYVLVNENARPVTLTRIPQDRPDAAALPEDHEAVPVEDFDTVRVGEKARFYLRSADRRGKTVTRTTTTVVEISHVPAAS
jgi:hypothetical protein